MEALGLLMHGFAVLLTWKTLLLMMFGLVLGIFVGVLPGLGGPNGVAILLPLTFTMDPTSAIVMLSCIYWGALFGGAITSILFNIPGEAWSVATNRGCHPCLVVNFHPDGAMLHSSTHHTAAFRFDLSLDGFKTTKHCRVVWRSGNTCGVEFIDQSSPSHH